MATTETLNDFTTPPSDSETAAADTAQAATKKRFSLPGKRHFKAALAGVKAGLRNGEAVAWRNDAYRFIGDAALRGAGVGRLTVDADNKASVAWNKKGVNEAWKDPGKAAVEGGAKALAEAARQLLTPRSFDVHIAAGSDAIAAFRNALKPVADPDSAPAAADFGPAAAATESTPAATASEQPATTMPEQTFTGRASVPQANLVAPRPTMPDRVARVSQ